MDDVGGGDDGLDGEVGLVQVGHDALADVLRRTVGGGDGLDGAVLVVGNFIQAGHVQARHLGGILQKLRPAPAFLLPLPVQVDHLQRHVLPFAQGEDVDEIRQRLPVVHAGAASHDDGVVLAPLVAVEGDVGQVQHIQHVGVGHLVAQGEAHKIELLQAVAALQSVEGDVRLAHLLLHVPPGGEGALAPDAVRFVHGAVEDAQSQVGHANFVSVREAHGEAHVHRGLVLDDLVVFPAGVASGFLYAQQNALSLCVNHDGSSYRAVYSSHGTAFFQMVLFYRKAAGKTRHLLQEVASHPACQQQEPHPRVPAPPQRSTHRRQSQSAGQHQHHLFRPPLS